MRNSSALLLSALRCCLRELQNTDASSESKQKTLNLRALFIRGRTCCSVEICYSHWAKNSPLKFYSILKVGTGWVNNKNAISQLHPSNGAAWLICALILQIKSFALDVLCSHYTFNQVLKLNKYIFYSFRLNLTLYFIISG